MIEQLLPACVAAVEVCRDELDVRLFPEEEVLVGKAVEKRRREFTTARACARAALGQIGLPVVPILTGERGEPLWPQNVVGSITHCEGYRACAVARSSEILTIGIDAEPNAALPEGLLADIARPEELPGLRAMATEYPNVHWDRLLFSAKESVYKAWFPLAERWLGFEDARITFDPGAHAFTANLLVSGPVVAGRPLSGFSGVWMVDDGLILTAITVCVA
jgi:enterobactin synthetase component D / holo-[acyl-carrier protein] synthase